MMKGNELEMNNEKLFVAYSDDYLNWQLGSGDGTHITKPIRAKLALEKLTNSLGSDSIEVVEPTVADYDRASLESIHHPKFVSDVIDRGVSYEWHKENLLMGHTALQMFSGTARLVEKIISGEARVGFNPQGAKHHAQYAWSEGFCVFNDFAWAAKEFERNGLKAVYIDWDVNAGDGVQNLLQDTDIPTFSIHGHGIYPTHSDTWYDSKYFEDEPYEYSNEEKHWYNYVLPIGSEGVEFSWAINEIAQKVEQYEPDVILLATGADAHESDIWGMKFTYEGYEGASSVVAELANRFAKGRVLIGGAGGYKPYDSTPEVWARVVSNIYRKTGKTVLA
jgi:acetoin utilization protein AcuC